MPRRYSIIVIILVLMTLALSIAGNTGSEQQENNIYFSGEIVGPDLVVTGAPYTATAVIDNSQTLADGNRIVHTATQLVARDSKGRVRRELTISAIGPIEVTGPKLILISDPVLKKQILLNVETKVAIIQSRRFIDLSTLLNSNAEKPKEKESEKPAKDSAENEPQRRRAENVISESLGTKVMEGLNVQGELNKWTIPPGKIGNKGPINVSVESWYSPDLKIELMRHRIDPRFGDVKYTLSNIERKEPQSALFGIPRNYKIVKGS